MLGALAGIVDRRARPDARRAEAALRADGGAAGSLVSGALALAWAGAADVARDGERVAAVEGVLDTAPRSAQALLAAWDGSDPGPVLDRLRGDFAVLLWDGRRGVIARDHLGARAWVFADDGGRLVFATEVATLLGLLPARPAPDPGSVGHWLSSSGMPQDRTLYAGVLRVRAGELLPIGGEHPARARRYWNPRYREPEPIGIEEAAARLRGALEASVVRKQRPGVTALQLSGGLDSTTVGGVAASALPAPERIGRAYSVVFPEHPSVDERALIEEVARHIGVTSTQVEVRRGSVLAGALGYLERWALPPVSPNLFFWRPMLDRAAQDGAAIMLDGEGGDEILGASPALIADVLRRRGPRAAADVVRRLPGGRPDLPRAHVRAYLRRWGLAALPPAWVHAASRRLRGPSRYAEDWMRPEVAHAYHATMEGGSWKRAAGPRWWAWLLDATTSGMGPALAYDHIRRRAAMSGLAARHPIADPDVIATVLQLPPLLQFDPRFSRPVVREAMRGLIPEAVRARPAKSTFDEIFHASLTGPDLPLLRGLAGAPDTRLAAYVDVGRLRATLLDPPPPPAGAARQAWALTAWRLLTLEAWLRLQEDAGAPRRAAEAIGLPAADCRVVGPPT